MHGKRVIALIVNMIDLLIRKEIQTAWHIELYIVAYVYIYVQSTDHMIELNYEIKYIYISIIYR